MLHNTTLCTLNKDLFIKVKNECFQLLTEHCCFHGGKIAMALKYPNDEVAKLYFVDFQVLNNDNGECLSVSNYNESGVLLDHKFYNMDYDESADMSKLWTEFDYMEMFCESLYCDVQIVAKLLNKILLIDSFLS